MRFIMATWVFEPGHTAAGFRARHMMVSWVRGHFKDVHGSLEFDPDNPAQLAIEATIQAGKLWTGEPRRQPPDRFAHALPGKVENALLDRCRRRGAGHATRLRGRNAHQSP